MALKAKELHAREILASSNQQLRIALADLQRISLVNEMAHLLHAAASPEELLRTAEGFAARVFPETSGTVWVLDSSGKAIEKAATWGSRSKVKLPLAADACVALRTGREHLVHKPESSRVCSHDPEGSEYPQICVPLVSQSTRLGVLNMRRRAFPSTPFAQSETRLFRTVAAEIALSLANFHLRESFKQQALHDPLTGLYNRRFLHEALELELRRAKRKGWPVGLVMIDVDNFKYFNDTFGHAAGDAMLQNIADSLQASVRSNDVLCRYGGDEFALVMPETSLKDVARWADRFRFTLPFPTVSMGAAAYPACLTSGALFLKADAALYAAKAHGRDQLKSG